jgi:hypothetical protein
MLAPDDVACPPDAEPVHRQFTVGCERITLTGPINVGHWIVRDSEGNILSDAHYDDQGNPHGKMVVFYHPNAKLGIKAGTKESESFYQHGTLHGLRKRWTASGAADGEECWVSGQRRSELGKCNNIVYREGVSDETTVVKDVPDPDSGLKIPVTPVTGKTKRTFR